MKNCEDRVLNRTISLPQSIWEKIEERARKAGVTRSKIVREIVEKYFEGVGEC